MATNRFATMIHHKTNRITLVLVYVFLEWSLIFFILLNSLFSYLILRFADYFGLKPPCLLCSRLDRFFDASRKSHPYRDLLCSDHALEISSVRSKPLDEEEVNVGSVHLIDSQEQGFTREEEEETVEKVNEQMKQEDDDDDEFSCYVFPEGLLTVDKLKLELEEERKALNALYEELEEERSASATAADETMAMINRLHEEKAAMQMEALQYQRMMEEQSEFDQEALQLWNELMVKREKELEACRERLEEYETKEKIELVMRRMRDDHSSVDSDHENTPVSVVLRLDECLDDYEGERLSLLERLKFLEERLTDLNDDGNGNNKGNGHFHGKETNKKHRVFKSKRLLPLSDAVDESEESEFVTMEEEIDEVYERLEALEADRGFLRHCVGSLKKGDKGVHLLYEILQHLRDLKNIDHIGVRDNEDMSF